MDIFLYKMFLETKINEPEQSDEDIVDFISDFFGFLYEELIIRIQRGHDAFTKKRLWRRGIRVFPYWA